MKKITALAALLFSIAAFGDDKATKETSSMTWERVATEDTRCIQAVRLVVKGTDTNRKFILTWSEVPDAKGYRIERSEGDRPFVKYGEVAAGVGRFEVGKLTVGTFVYLVYPIM